GNHHRKLVRFLVYLIFYRSLSHVLFLIQILMMFDIKCTEYTSETCHQNTENPCKVPHNFVSLRHSLSTGCVNSLEYVCWLPRPTSCNNTRWCKAGSMERRYRLPQS